jgi:hypothetical protein
MDKKQIVIIVAAVLILLSGFAGYKKYQADSAVATTPATQTTPAAAPTPVDPYANFNAPAKP